MIAKQHSYPINAPGVPAGRYYTNDRGLHVDIFYTRDPSGDERWVTYRTGAGGLVGTYAYTNSTEMGKNERTLAKLFDQFMADLGKRPCPLDAAPSEPERRTESGYVERA